MNLAYVSYEKTKAHDFTHAADDYDQNWLGKVQHLDCIILNDNLILSMF